MFLAITAVIGFGLGFWLEMSRAGYLTMALTTPGFFAAEIIHVRAAQKRGSVGENKRVIITMLPLVIGLVLVVCMLLGAFGAAGCSWFVSQVWPSGRYCHLLSWASHEPEPPQHSHQLEKHDCRHQNRGEL